MKDHPKSNPLLPETHREHQSWAVIKTEPGIFQKLVDYLAEKM